MKISHAFNPGLMLLAVALAGAVGASAQTNSGTPAASDYAALSRFVTDRNIFDPGRQPHSASLNKRTQRVTRTHSTSAPAFTFVGTMSYEKGLFAFFSGNSDDLKKVLPASGAIAGHTVVEMAPGLVTLESDDKKERVRLRVGDVMRQENGKWEWSGAGVAPLAESVNATESAGAAGANNPPAAPSPALGQNDVLKRLMEKRAKESQ